MPPSGTGRQGPQMPEVLPGRLSHDEPGQQSALIVHLPHVDTHAAEPHTKGGVAPVMGFGTQGRPLQQSALEAHA